MYRISKVYARRPVGQIEYVAFGSKDEYLVGIQIHFEHIQIFLRVACLFLKLHNVSYPRKLIVVYLRRIGVGTLLVFPVRRDTVFCHFVHLVRTDLNLERRAVCCQHRCVQGLIHICFRHRNIILESTGKRFPLGMNRTEYGIAILDVIHDNSQRYQIVDLLKRFSLFQLSVNAVKMLGTSVDFAFYAQFFEHILKLF